MDALLLLPLLPGMITRRAGWEGGRNLSGFSRVGVDCGCCGCCCFGAGLDFLGFAERSGEVEKGEEDCERAGTPPRCRRAALWRRESIRAVEDEGIPLGTRNWGVERKDAMAFVSV